jgi:hypothetical protein
MPDLLDEKHQEITDRIKQLSPIVEEHRRLKAAAKALAVIRRSTATGVTTRRRGPGRSSGPDEAATAPAAKKARRPKKAGRPAASVKATTSATPAATTKRRAGTRKGSGTRAAQALAHIKEQPGITIPELAAKMEIKHNYLYRVLPTLQKERKVTKQDKGWHPRRK